MKTVQYRMVFVMAFLMTIILSAQDKKKNFKERFIVKSDVVVDINTKYTDIEIETWDKNEVVVEAFMKIDGEVDNKMRDDFYNRWDFEAIGNKDKVKIKSGSSSFIDIHSFDFDAPDYDIIVEESLRNVNENLRYVLPEISVASLELLDSLDFVMPDIVIPPMPPVEPFVFDFDDIFMVDKFDFKKYKKDKNYLKEWKERNRGALRGADIKIGKNSIIISTDRDDLSAEELEKRQEELEKRIEEREKRYEERIEKRAKEYEMRLKERKEKLKEKAEKRKLDLVKRQETLEKRREALAKHREDVRVIVKNRDKLKVKKHIKIKAPKGAKFNMNVRYGTLSFPK